MGRPSPPEPSNPLPRGNAVARCRAVHAAAVRDARMRPRKQPEPSTPLTAKRFPQGGCARRGGCARQAGWEARGEARDGRSARRSESKSQVGIAPQLPWRSSLVGEARRPRRFIAKLRTETKCHTPLRQLAPLRNCRVPMPVPDSESVSSGRLAGTSIKKFQSLLAIRLARAKRAWLS